MFKKYIITSKFRFTVFTAILVIALATAVSGIAGFNTAAGGEAITYKTVTVNSGDTLWSIASTYCSDDQDVREYIYNIEKLNDVQNVDIQPGQKIIVPVKGQM